MRSGSTVRGVAIAVTALALNTGVARAQLLEATTSAVTTPDGQAIEVTTGFVRVPELRAPDGTTSGTIDLAVVRLRRPGTSVRSSAHVILAGGPGDSGVNIVMGLARQGSPAVWQLFDGDVVGIDQRGSGRSRPNLDTQARCDLPLDKPGSAREWLPHIERVSRMVAGEFRARGIRLEAYNTRESADDVADVRRALGYAQLTLWGRSYGSHLALATVARHPRMVDRLVLVSPEGPNHTWKLPSQIDVVIRRLEERGATNLEAHVRTVLTRLSADPATGTCERSTEWHSAYRRPRRVRRPVDNGPRARRSEACRRSARRLPRDGSGQLRAHRTDRLGAPIERRCGIGHEAHDGPQLRRD